MTLTRYNLDNLNNIWNADKFFNSAWDDLFFRALPVKQKSLGLVKVKDLDDHSEISISAPGLVKGDFDISLKDDCITISYERSKEDNPRLFSKNAFSRTWSIPQSTKAKDISAKYDAGILTVSIKKNAKAAPKSHSIKVL
tara:strand:+ start:648 stop:1067 length:420 start_codon:yes stop_codon:yes gene_type:complete